MDYNDFARKVKHNTEVVQDAIDTKKKLVTVADNLYTWTTAPGQLHSSVLIRSLHDILPAAYVGLLANIANNGVDAFKVNPDNTIVDYELKTSEVNSKRVWQSVNGTLYNGDILGGRNNNTCINSSFRASYNIHSNENRETKNVNTVLFVTDVAGQDGYIDAWHMDGDVLSEHYLRDRKGKIEIKLGSFMKWGHKTNTAVTVKGWDNWVSEMRSTVPVKTTKQKE